MGILELYCWYSHSYQLKSVLIRKPWHDFLVPSMQPLAAAMSKDTLPITRVKRCDSQAADNAVKSTGTFILFAASSRSESGLSVWWCSLQLRWMQQGEEVLPHPQYVLFVSEPWTFNWQKTHDEMQLMEKLAKSLLIQSARKITATTLPFSVICEFSWPTSSSEV